MAVTTSDNKPYVVGVDVGGTNTVFGIVDARGTIIRSGKIKSTNHIKVEDYVVELAEAITDIANDAGGIDQIHGVGMGAPNGNYFTGSIDFAPNLLWKGRIPMAYLLSKALNDIPVALTNDANAAAIGEMTYGAARAR